MGNRLISRFPPMLGIFFKPVSLDAISQFSPAANAPNWLQTQAQQAIAQNAVLDFTRSGMPILKGQNWRGRAALWLKDRLIPGHRYQRHLRVINALNHATRFNRSKGAFPPPPRKPLYARKARHHASGNTSHALLHDVLLRAAHL